MYCKRCGYEISALDTVCPECKQIVNLVDPIPLALIDMDEDELGVEEEACDHAPITPSENKPKNNKYLKYVYAGLVTISALLLIFVFHKSILGLYYGFFDYETPASQFQYIEQQSAEKMASTACMFYGKYLSSVEQMEKAGAYEGHLLLGEQAQILLSDYLFPGEDVDISWISDIMLKMDANSHLNLSQSTISVGIGHDEVLSADVITDVSQHAMWLAIPELSGYYLKLDGSEYQSLYDTLEFISPNINEDNYTNYTAALPSEEVAYNLLLKYSDLLLENITDVRADHEVITIDDISQECTVLTARIPERTLLETAVSMLNEIKEDELIIGVICDMAQIEGQNPDKVKSAFIEDINLSVMELESAISAASELNYIEWIDYIDQEDMLIGRRFRVSGSQDEMYYLTLKDQERFMYRAVVPQMLEIQGNGNSSGNILNACYEILVDEKPYVNIELIEFNKIKLAMGLLGGKLRIEPCSAMYRDIWQTDVEFNAVLEFNVDTTDLQKQIACDIWIDNALFGSITFNQNDKEASDIKQPTKLLDPSNEAELTRWLQTLDFDALIFNLRKTQMPESLVDAFEEYFAELKTALKDQY